MSKKFFLYFRPTPRLDRGQKRPNREHTRPPRETKKMKYVEGVFSHGIQDAKPTNNRYVERVSQAREAGSAKTRMLPKNNNHVCSLGRCVAIIFTFLTISRLPTVQACPLITTWVTRVIQMVTVITIQSYCHCHVIKVRKEQFSIYFLLFV